jgi:hypothetical protein
MIRHLIKIGHYNAFMADIAAWNVEAVRLGLPPYQVWDSQFGAVQEVFTTAEFESVDAFYELFSEAHRDEVFGEAQARLGAHFVEGSLHDWWLDEIEAAAPPPPGEMG